MVALAVAAIDIVAELIRCKTNVLYFVWNYCRIKDQRSKGWVPFALWPDQADVLQLLRSRKRVILLKARQIGMTTLVVCYAVWLAIFRPGSTILIFSKTQREAKDMLKRIKQTIRRLPEWMQPAECPVDATQELELSNGSRFITFASRGPGGDSYTADLVIIDEADLIPELNELLEGAEPTVGAEGQLVLLSRANKRGTDAPNSPFKAIWRAAVAGSNDYAAKFIPWHSRPERTQDWYEAQKRSIESRTGYLDDLFAQYPATPEEALAPRSADRRFPFKWLQACFEPGKPLPLTLTPFAGVDGCRIYELPQPGRDYIVGVDVALGNPNSDDSVCCVLDRQTLRQVAVLVGKYEPSVLATYAKKLADFYRNAWINVERNNHGFACLDELRKLRGRVLAGRDNKPGWWTDLKGKFMMYDAVADSLRCGSCTIRDQQTFDQLTALAVGTLSAPEGEHDDCAVAFALALVGAATPVRKGDLNVITYKRQQEAEPPPKEEPSETPGVTHFPNMGEWWVQREIDGQRHDLYCSADREDAERAAAAIDALLAWPNGADGPIGQSIVEVKMFEVMRDRALIGRCAPHIGK